jgi:hypothetical protein
MFSDAAPNMAETQYAIRESQSQVQSANPSKRRRDEGTVPAAHPKKKRRQPAAEPSSGQLQFIDGIVVTSEPPASSELSLLNPIPQFDSQKVGSGPDEGHVQSKLKRTIVVQDDVRVRKKAQPTSTRQTSLLEDIAFSSDLEDEGKDEAEDEVNENSQDTLLGPFPFSSDDEYED